MSPALDLLAASGSAPGAPEAPGLFLADRLSALALGGGLGVGGLFALAALGAQRRGGPAAPRFGLLLFGICGALLTSAANDLALLFLGLELVALSMTGLLWLGADSRPAREAALKHFVLGLLATGFFLYGLALVYGLTGTTRLSAAGELAAASRPSPAGIVALGLLFGGLGFRMGVVPFHFGLAEIAQGTSAWNAGLMAVLVRGTAFVALVRLAPWAGAGHAATAQLLALVLSGVTMLVAGALALRAANVRRILTYSTAAHVGFALAGLAVGLGGPAAPGLSLAADGLPGGVAAALYALGAYVLAASGLFALLAYLDRGDRQIDSIDDLAGLARTEPLAAGCAAVLLLGLAGLPPLAGFWGRTILTLSVLSVPSMPREGADPVPHGGFLLLAVAACLHLLMTAAVYLRIVGAMFLAGPAGRPRPAGGQGALAAAVLAATLTIGAGLIPGPLVEGLDGIAPQASGTRDEG